MPKVMLEGYKCERCGHTWVPRANSQGEPVICPKCKSPYWNRPRLSDAGKVKEAKVKEGKVR